MSKIENRSTSWLIKRILEITKKMALRMTLLRTMLLQPKR